MSMTNNTATKACTSCRDRKRKCDRSFPSCSLCYRLGRQCHYEPSTRSYALARESSVVAVERSSVSPLNAQAVSPPKYFADGKFIESSVSTAITEQLSHIVGDLQAVREIVVRYFRSIQLWFPILSEESCYKRLSNTYTQPCADFSLLMMSLALIISMPSNDGAPPPLYTVVKSSIGITEAANIHSLEVVQSRLLVTLFEVGHGLDTAAFISLGATARAAVAIGLNQTIHNPCTESASILSSSEQGLRIWWAIVMLDRHYSLERGDGPCATHGLGSPKFLPRDNHVLDQNILASDQPLPLSTPSNIRVGPFARQAQVSHVLGILLMHLGDIKRQKEVDLEESDQIARTLTAFSLLLPEEAPQPWPRYCGALGMCFSALMTLHDSRPKTNPAGEGLQGPESFESSMERLSLVAAIFNGKINQVDVEAISPFPPDGVFKAATIQYQLWEKTGNSKYLEGANSLMLMMKYFSKRWVNAANYLSRLEKQRNSKEPI